MNRAWTTTAPPQPLERTDGYRESRYGRLEKRWKYRYIEYDDTLVHFFQHENDGLCVRCAVFDVFFLFCRCKVYRDVYVFKTHATDEQLEVLTVPHSATHRFLLRSFCVLNVFHCFL